MGENIYKVVIHDLSKESWEAIKDQYEEYEVITDDGKIKPCVGCFGCWLKTPGECVIKDAYSQSGARIGRAQELVIISQLTFGGFSGFVKNVIDRSISCSLPYFQIRNGEMHHVPRYPKVKKNVKVIYYGDDLSQQERKVGEEYANAMGVNIMADSMEIIFSESSFVRNQTTEKNHTKSKNVKNQEESAIMKNQEEQFASNNLSEQMQEKDNQILFINFSLRGKNANTRISSEKVIEHLNDNQTQENFTEASVVDYISYQKNQADLIEMIHHAKAVVFGMPLYVDGAPSQVVRFMENLYAKREDMNIAGKKLYLISNLGFYDGQQLRHMTQIVRVFAEKMGFVFGGSLGVAAGEMLAQLMKSIPLNAGPLRKAGATLIQFSEAVGKEEVCGDLVATPYAFPRCAYIICAHQGWNKQLKKIGMNRRMASKPIAL